MLKQGLCERLFLALGAVLASACVSGVTHARAETVLYSFAGGSDGEHPVSDLIADQAGNLYGTTEFGGGMCKEKYGCGTVFSLSPNGKETVLYAFPDRKDGKWPLAGLTADSMGNLYGTAAVSGNEGGTVFEITADGIFKALYGFKGGSDGFDPAASLILDQSGNLYGTTAGGGMSNCVCGTVFKVTPEGGHTILYSFQGGNDGADSQAPLIFDTMNNLYGTTVLGGGAGCGRNGCGTVFELMPEGTEKVLYAFKGGHDGWSPAGGLVLDASGNLYGMTSVGGGTGCGGSGCGTVFQIAPGGRETIVSRFNRPSGPSNPVGGLIIDDQGDLFGTTIGGGPDGCGTVFEITPGRQAKSIHSFSCGNDGAHPAAGLLRDANGVLYGTTENGGTSNLGTVFALQQ